MLLVLATAVAMVLWVLLWSLGAKGFDAFLLSGLIVLIAATVHVILPYLPGRRRKSDQAPDPAPFT